MQIQQNSCPYKLEFYLFMWHTIANFFHQPCDPADLFWVYKKLTIHRTSTWTVNGKTLVSFPFPIQWNTFLFNLNSESNIYPFEEASTLTLVSCSSWSRFFFFFSYTSQLSANHRLHKHLPSEHWWICQRWPCLSRVSLYWHWFVSFTRPSNDPST